MDERSGTERQMHDNSGNASPLSDEELTEVIVEIRF